MPALSQSNNRVYIGLGSNLGDRLEYLAFARRQLNVAAESPIYASPAMLPKGAPASWNIPYLNQVIAMETALEPEALLVELKRIEHAAGRRDRGRWSPRELDLDIVDYHGVRLEVEGLTLPHAQMAQRDFVLLPLRDIAPDYPDIDAMIAALRDITLRPYHPRMQVMGILNITPDSFSDGGAMDVASVLARFEQLVADGADIIDIGAESTRPDATPLSAEAEWARLEAPLSAIMAHPLRAKVAISIDTRHARTAERALALGVTIINDVSGLADPAMRDILAPALCDVVVMHALTVPVDRNVTLPEGCDPVAELLAWKTRVLQCGIAPDRLIFDAGIGFGKTAEQSRQLAERAGELKQSGGRWLMGHSRKSFMPVPLEQRDRLTLEYSRRFAAQDIDMVRVHDVAGHAELLARAIEESPPLEGIKLGLERLQHLLDALGNPERRLPPTIHLAGTNGKGSVLAYLKAMYEAAGKRVHAYTSPHLVRYNERVVLAGKQVSDARLLDAILRVRAVEGDNPVTVFERITAAAYLCFAEVPADVLLLETGLGGRLDATNIPEKIAAVLTPIGMDHMEYLGDSLGAIAGEKAAIMRAAVPCICTPQSEEVSGILMAHATRIGAPLYWAEMDETLLPSLNGPHQRDNVSLAAAVARRLGVAETAVVEGARRAVWPARLQCLRYGPLVRAWGKRGTVMLDGGHNAHAAAVLAQWAAVQPVPVVLVCGLKARKDALAWMQALAPAVAEVICVPAPGEDAHSARALAEMASSAGVAKVRALDALSLLEEALRGYPVTDAQLLIAGSLYLAGEALKTHG